MMTILKQIIVFITYSLIIIRANYLLVLITITMLLVAAFYHSHLLLCLLLITTALIIVICATSQLSTNACGLVLTWICHKSGLGVKLLLLLLLLWRRRRIVIVVESSSNFQHIASSGRATGHFLISQYFLIINPLLFQRDVFLIIIKITSLLR